MHSCKTCRWTACRNYGKNIGICKKYIPDLSALERRKINVLEGRMINCYSSIVEEDKKQKKERSEAIGQ